MKKTIMLITWAICSNLAVAQSATELEFTKNKEVVLNRVKLDTTTSIDDIKRILGDPVIHKEYTSGKINYHYKELGIAVHTVNGKLLFIGVNLNWDGDKNFPEKPYQGTLKIDGILIDRTSNQDFVKEIKCVVIECPMPIMCMNNPDKESTGIMIGFENNLVTQVGFEFH